MDEIPQSAKERKQALQQALRQSYGLTHNERGELVNGDGPRRVNDILSGRGDDYWECRFARAYADAELAELRAKVEAMQAAMVEVYQQWGHIRLGYATRKADITDALDALGEPLHPFLPAPQPDPLPQRGEVWSYKGKDYFVLNLDQDCLIQHEGEWSSAVAYRCEPDTGLSFCRALPDFLAKFARHGLEISKKGE